MRCGDRAWPALAMVLLGATLAPAVAAELTEAEIVRRLQAPPAAPAASDDAVMAALAGRQEGGQSKALRMPNHQGLCTAEAGHSGGHSTSSGKTLEIVAVAPPGAPRVDFSLKFEYGVYVLTQTDRNQLDVLARALNRPELESARFTVVGHTDTSGDATINLKLSCGRALSAMAYLLARGVAASRLSAYGFGQDQLLPGLPPTSEQHRRVEVRRSQD